MNDINEHVRIRLENTQDLPSMPAVAVKILDLAQSPISTMGQVADAVGYDPALSTKLMKVANSPLYNQRRGCENIRQAVMALGLNSTMMMTLSFSLISSLRDQETGLDYDRYWRRSLLSSSAARLLAMQTEDISPEEAFLAALLQDIGMVVLDIAFDNFYQESVSKDTTHNEVCAIEKVKVSCDHSDIGAWLLERWNFPPRLINAVYNSHNFNNINSPEDIESIDQCVAIAGPIADALMAADLNQTQDDTDIPLHWLSDHYEPILEELCDELPILEELFEFKLMDSRYSDELSNRAKELMLLRGLNTAQELTEARRQLEIHQLRNEHLANQAYIDHLTQVGNRKSFDTALEEEFLHARNNTWPLSLVFIDIDSFKSINDQYGHASGDALLQHTAKIIKQYTRENDQVYRYAGDEFCILLAGESRQSAMKAGMRIDEALKASPLALEEEEPLFVSCSIGVACFDETQQFKSHLHLFKAADQAMYNAKNNGGSRVAVWHPPKIVKSGLGKDTNQSAS